MSIYLATYSDSTIPATIAAIGQSSDRGLDAVIHVAVRADGLAGSGTAEDPFDGSTNTKLQSIISAANEGAVLRLAAGLYGETSLTVSKSLTIEGVGHETILGTDAGGAMITWSGSGKDLVLKNLALVYSGGFQEAAGNVGVIGGSSGGRITMTDVLARDLNNSIYLTTAGVEGMLVENCDFIYTYGRAGIANESPYQHPAVSILGGARNTIVRNCRFNGLVDPTFSGVMGSPPSTQMTPADGIYKTGGADPDVQIICGNEVRNHGVEGILVERSTVAGSYIARIHDNVVIGPDYKNPDFYGDYTPGILVAETRNAEVFGNSVYGEQIGINIAFQSDDELNVCVIYANRIAHCVGGISASRTASKAHFFDNSIHCSSLPVKETIGQQTVPCELRGLTLNNGMVVGNTILMDEPAWDAEMNLVSRSGNVFTVDDATGIVPNSGVLTFFQDERIAWFPVEGVTGNQVTVSNDWVIAQSWVTSGPLYYAEAAANFHAVGAVCLFGSSSEDQVMVTRNVITGAFKDVSPNNVGRFTVSGNTLLSVRQVPPASAYVHRVGANERDGLASFSGELQGTSTNDDAPEGVVGEIVTSVVTAGLPVTLTTGSSANLTSITLSPGDWDVDYDAYFSLGAATVTRLESSISGTSAVISATPGEFITNPLTDTALTSTRTQSKSSVRVSVGTQTTIYFVVKGIFSAGSVGAYGAVRARRVR